MVPKGGGGAKNFQKTVHMVYGLSLLRKNMMGLKTKILTVKFRDS